MTRGAAALVAAVLLPALSASGVAALLTRPAQEANALAVPPELVRLATLAPRTAGQRPAEPSRIAIPAAGVAAPVDPVGQTPAGIEVPPVERAGWFQDGPRPGEAGQAVMIGHVDSRSGPGVFARLAALTAGSTITVTDEREEIHRYRVVRAEQVDKDAFPSDSVYAASPRPALVLITCGGPYAKGEGYRDNVIVYARA